MLAGFPVYFVKASSIARACIRYWLLVVVFRIFSFFCVSKILPKIDPRDTKKYLTF